MSRTDRASGLPDKALAKPGEALREWAGASAPVWSFANFQAVFRDLTGEDARPTLWRGRPRPRCRPFSTETEFGHFPMAAERSDRIAQA